MDRDTFISFFPYAAALVIGPGGLLLDLPLLTLIACTIAFAIVLLEFGGLIQLPLLLYLSLELAAGVVSWVEPPWWQEAAGPLVIAIAAVPIFVGGLALIGWVTGSLFTRRSDQIRDRVDEMPLSELVPALRQLELSDHKPLERRIVKRMAQQRHDATRLMVERYGQTRNVEEKTRLIHFLERLNGAEALTFLAGRLREEQNRTLLRAAVEAAGQTRNATFVGALSKLASVTDDNFIWGDAYEALARIGAPEAIDALSKRLSAADEGDVDYATSRVIAGCQHSKSEAAIALLVSVAGGTAEMSTRLAAAAALHAQATAKAIGALDQLLNDSTDTEFQELVVQRLNWPRSKSMSWMSKRLEKYADALKQDTSTERRVQVIYDLKKVRSDEALDVVKRALVEEKERGERGDSEVIETLQYAISDWD